MSWKQLLSSPGACDHLVQFYGDERSLAENVALYLKEGADRGDALIVIATSSHRRMFAEILAEAGVDAGELSRKGRMLALDAEETLAKLLPRGEPEWQIFDEIVGGAVREFRLRSGGAGLRAYGEMVDLLWKAGKLSAATKLEGFWNQLLEESRFGLFCAYTVDVLAAATPGPALQEMISTHSHLLPTRSNGELDRAVSRAMTDVLGEKTVAALQPIIQGNVVSRVVLPQGERTVLWLRKNLPPYAGEVLSRARAHYEEECAREGGGRRA